MKGRFVVLVCQWLPEQRHAANSAKLPNRRHDGGQVEFSVLCHTARGSRRSLPSSVERILYSSKRISEAEFKSIRNRRTVRWLGPIYPKRCKSVATCSVQTSRLLTKRTYLPAKLIQRGTGRSTGDLDQAAVGLVHCKDQINRARDSESGNAQRRYDNGILGSEQAETRKDYGEPKHDYHEKGPVNSTADLLKSRPLRCCDVTADLQRGRLKPTLSVILW